MRYLTHQELKKMIFCSFERIERDKEKINKINVFPVPDMDTGNNLARTLEGIKKAIEKEEFKNLEELASAALDGALNSAQGNVGVIYTGFLAGFLPLLNKNPIDSKKLALAFEKGLEKARESILNPREGTILDVIEAITQCFKEKAEKEENIINLFKKAILKAQKALLRTRDKIEILKKANVVDAGGLGFLMILESHLEALEPAEAKASADRKKLSEKIEKFVQTISYRYEVVFLIEKLKVYFPELKEKLARKGDSLEVLKIKDKIKVHIHTDDPKEVEETAREAGEILDFKVQDITKEILGEETQKEISIGIVTEDVTTLLPKILEKYQIEIARVKLDWPELEKIPGENIYQKMREMEKRGIKSFPKTSQAMPKDYLDAFKKQLKKFDKVLCITLTSKVSGCYNSAIQAKKMSETPERIFVFDSLQAAASQALLVLRAIELIQERKEIEEIIKELKNLIPKTHLYLIFEDPKWIENLGRITKNQADWVRRMKKMRLHPIMALKDGQISKGGIVFAKDAAETIFKKILKDSREVRAESRSIRVIINHADNLEQAEKLKKMLKEKIGAQIPFINEGPPIICAGAGPGTLLVGWQPI